jgi:hypothetical protein
VDGEKEEENGADILGGRPAQCVVDSGAFKGVDGEAVIVLKAENNR